MSNSKTLEDLLRMTVPAKDKDGNDIQITPEFRLAVQNFNKEGGIHFIVHANGYNSDTLDYIVKDNTLKYLESVAHKGEGE